MIKRLLHPLDIHIGVRLRCRRKMLALSQDGLGKSIGVTFQQIQKYERGINSINAHRLYDLALALGVTISYFYEGYGSAQPLQEAPIISAQHLGLMQDYADIPSEKLKRSIAALVREVAKGDRDGL